ncbi:hypothetical protein ACFL6L_01590 [candidate division KSB1 bacterium]
MIHATKLSDVSNIYRTESHRFVDAYFRWLEEAEIDLSGLRSPISILLQSEKSSVSSVLDGFLPPEIQGGKSIRKSQKAVAAQSLERISKEIYAKIENIDRAFDQLSEKLCHAVAVLASKEPKLYNDLQVNRHGVDKIWKLLSRTPETKPMYNYFCAKLTPTDINYLLMEIIQRIVNNTDTNENENHRDEKHVRRDK